MDNEDIEKVNSEETPKVPAEENKADAFDEIMQGMYDLARTYGNEETDREKEMRERDEKRREEEMAAIREDIERRYSLQVEEAKNNMDSIMGISSKNTDAGSANDDISRLDEMIDLQAFRDEDGKKKKKEKKKKQKKEKKEKKIKYIDLDETNIIYYSLYTLGDAVVKEIARILGFILHFVSLPVKKVRRAVRSATAGTKRRLNTKAKDAARELVYFRREIKSANKYLMKSLRHPLSLPGILGHYIGKAISRHKELLRTVFNTLLPIGALVILILTFSYWNSVTFALEVFYDGQSIGCISDESVFIEAKDLVTQRLSANSINSEVTQAQSADLNVNYELTVVSLDELSDAYTISDEMVRNSTDNLTNACGVYIDGELICAIKNESDAKTVFYNILEPYEEDAEANGYVVGFAEDIDYVQGLYRDIPSVMWDASELEATVLGEDGATAYYTLESGDTIDSVAVDYDLTSQELADLNPDIDMDSLKEGDTIQVPSTGSRLVNIKKTITSSAIESIPYETVTRRDVTKYSGFRETTQEGVDGTKRVITTKTYINGTLEDTSVKNVVLEESVDEIITVGTMTTYNGVYIGEASDMGFLWPAPHCHYISSPYGWRSSGWHKGVDLCTTNGTANGSPVIAARSGTVEVVQHSNSGYGNMVLINHGDGYKTRYAHMQAGSITVSVGDYVDGGTAIGKVGSTGNSSGPHLHFEVIYNGETQDPKNFIS